MARGGEVVAIIAAGGAGERLGSGIPKAFLEIAQRPMVAIAADAAAACPEVDALVVAVPSGFEDRASDALRATAARLRVVAGGSSREESVRLALAATPESCRIAVVHDAARPLATAALFSAVVRALEGADPDTAGAIPVVPVADTLKRVSGDEVVGTEARASVRAAQTPQAFRATVLRDAHARAVGAGREFTDDAAVVEWSGGRVIAMPGESRNFKITTADDLLRAEALLSSATHG